MNDLQKSLGLPALVALGAAGVLGTSWIYTNGDFFAKYGAGGEIFGLALGAVLAAFIALSYAELASTFPRAGGEIVFGYLAFNRTVGFLAGWLLIGAYISSIAFYVTAAGMLLSDIFPSLSTIPLYTIADAGSVSLLNDTLSLQVVTVDEQLQATVVHLLGLGKR